MERNPLDAPAGAISVTSDGLVVALLLLVVVAPPALVSSMSCHEGESLGSGIFHKATAARRRDRREVVVEGGIYILIYVGSVVNPRSGASTQPPRAHTHTHCMHSSQFMLHLRAWLYRWLFWGWRRVH